LLVFKLFLLQKSCNKRICCYICAINIFVAEKVKQNNEQKYWIIMADIVDSGLGDSVLLQNEFAQCVQIVNEKCKKHLLSPLTVTLGDEFQALAQNLKAAAKLMLYFEELIVEKNYSFALRWVVHWGPIDTPINHQIAYGMLGSGLAKARELLNNLKKTDFRYQIETGVAKKNDALNNAFVIYDNIINKWKTTDDRALVAQFMKHPDYKTVAEILGKDRSQIWKRRNSLEIIPYFAIKNLINYIAK
jgi:hypothetical protein